MVGEGGRRALVALVLLVTGFDSFLIAGKAEQRWGIVFWGLSYHFDREIDYDELNVGLGLRYYVNHRLFVEGDALRNSNRGLAVPLSAGVELPVASLGSACHLDLVGAVTVAYYQDARTEREYIKGGPVPGVTLGCGRVRTNAILVLRTSHQPVAAVAASLTVQLR